MKKNLILAGVLMLGVTLSQATLYNSGTITVGQAIPDGNPVGYATKYTFSTGDASAINGVSVAINLGGGYNGDLYGYLVNPNGDLAVLLNRVGTGGGNSFGYGDAGLNVILSETGVVNIHNYGTGDISSGTAAYAPDNGAGNFSALHTGTVNGTWTLFLADLAAGDQSTLVSWGLSINVVPEPVSWALTVMACAGGLLAVRRYRMTKQN